MTEGQTALGEDTSSYRLDFATLSVPEVKLAEVRRNLYHSSGAGYQIFEGFLSPPLASHMGRFWSELDPSRLHQPYRGVQGMTRGCANFSYAAADGSRAYFNFFWNHPADEATFAASMQLQWLRNRVMGKAPFEEIYPLYGRSASYRVVITVGGDTIIAPHADWTGADYIREPARLQATLYLSTPGIDYEGDGFIFRTNQGDDVVFGRDVPVRKGDLVFWRYCNEHSVANVHTPPGRPGFIRILYPPEAILDPMPDVRKAFWQIGVTDIRDRVAATRFGQRFVRPVYRKLRGRR